ncbi:MAG: DUF2183 domain-containing protein [Candidatus Eisenbacteria bacterium]|nr:DUF2183 domain-containing protein [Candidatus Latescibacterota bacterium]MBD3302837.1 DUF2183 domain-containing protein [Candidatus Eisenbacteria bacterium]
MRCFRRRGGTTMTWKEEITDLMTKATSRVEDVIDVMWRKTSERLGWDKPEVIVAFMGYADHEQVRVRGRVLANAPHGGPQEDDTWWTNLAETYRRIASREIPDIEVELAYGGMTQTVRTDEEGYYFATFPRRHERTRGLRWRGVHARTKRGENEAESSHRVLFPGDAARYLVVSDLDDTVIETGITSLLLMARLTFLSNARTRSALPGVQALYEAFRWDAAPKAERPGAGINPIFYVSNGPWNLYDLLRDFLEVNRIPEGPIFLQDWGFDDDKLVKPPGNRHKIERITQLLRSYPDLPTVLLGDSGEHDASTYVEIARKHPGRVRAIYIRDVDPGLLSQKDEVVEEVAKEAEKIGVPLLSGESSVRFAEHAASIGLIPEGAVESVKREAGRDLSRASLGSETIG